MFDPIITAKRKAKRQTHLVSTACCFRKKKKGVGVPGEGAADLVDVAVAEDAPEAVEGGVLRAERGRITEEEAKIRQLAVETCEEGGKGTGMGREVLVAAPLVVVSLTHLAVLEHPLLFVVSPRIRTRLLELRHRRRPRSSVHLPICRGEVRLRSSKISRRPSRINNFTLDNIT